MVLVEYSSSKSEKRYRQLPLFHTLLNAVAFNEDTEQWHAVPFMDMQFPVKAGDLLVGAAAYYSHHVQSKCVRVS